MAEDITRMHDIDPRLVTLFNRAARAGRDGDAKRALSVYRELAEAITRTPTAASGDFRATTHMRIGFCLMDEGRHLAALDAFERAAPDLEWLDPGGRYEYFFALGNTLGNLGRIPEMTTTLGRARGIAERELSDLHRAEACHRLGIMHATEAERWADVHTLAAAARVFAVEHGLDELRAITDDVLKLVEAAGQRDTRVA